MVLEKQGNALSLADYTCLPMALQGDDDVRYVVLEKQGNALSLADYTCLAIVLQGDDDAYLGGVGETR